MRNLKALDQMRLKPDCPALALTTLRLGWVGAFHAAWLLSISPAATAEVFSSVLRDAGALANGDYDIDVTVYTTENAGTGEPLSQTTSLRNHAITGGDYDVDITFLTAGQTPYGYVDVRYRKSGETLWTQIDPRRELDPDGFFLIDPPPALRGPVDLSDVITTSASLPTWIADLTGSYEGGGIREFRKLVGEIVDFDDSRVAIFDAQATNVWNQFLQFCDADSVASCLEGLAGSVSAPCVTASSDQIQPRRINPYDIDPNDPDLSNWDPALDGVPGWSVSPRAIHYTGFVYYLNGVYNTENNAVAGALSLAYHLRQQVRLLYNRSGKEAEFLPGKGFVIDGVEFVFDKVFPAVIWSTGALCISTNPQTRQIANLLFQHRERNEKVSIVTHSQGCVIFRNALLDMYYRDPTSLSWIENNIAWVACGAPIGPLEVFPKPNRFQIINNQNDPIPNLGGDFTVSRIVGLDLKDHAFAPFYAHQVDDQGTLFPAHPNTAIHVDASRVYGGDGSPSSPVGTINDGLSLIRKNLAGRTDEPVVLRIKDGSYPKGSFNPPVEEGVRVRFETYLGTPVVIGPN
jgi:hypothetical protein